MNRKKERTLQSKVHLEAYQCNTNPMVSWYNSANEADTKNHKWISLLTIYNIYDAMICKEIKFEFEYIFLGMQTLKLQVNIFTNNYTIYKEMLRKEIKLKACTTVIRFYYFNQSNM